jgi:uncharacterized protein with HEPN domain
VPPVARDARLYLEDMSGFCETVRRYTAGFDKERLLADTMRFDATLRNLELIGEAASHVPPEWRERAPGVPWRQLVATRNRLIHAYLGLDPDIIWSIVTDDIPTLQRELTLLLAQA